MGISSGLKKIVSISLFIFWAAVTAVLVAGLLFYQKNPNNNSGSVPLLPSGSGQIVLDSQEIAKHDSQSDCWMIIDSKVYNLTSYLGEHPGGAAPMLPYCGKDGSEAFATKDRSRPQPHSGYADSLLFNYYIGDFNQRISLSQGSPQSQSPAPGANISATDPTPSPKPSELPASVNAANVTLSAQEIAKHNSTRNCWLVINNKVYNVTNYLGAHPGGVSAIAPYCGKDATQAFASLPHSSYANSLLINYYIGNLNQAIGAAQIQKNIQDTAQATPPPANGSKDYEEYDD